MCGSREDAEDLVQETYAKVLAKPRFLRNDDDLGYLLSVLRNTFASSYRTAARRPRTEALPDTAEPVDPRLGSRPHEAASAREVFGLIGALKPTSAMLWSPLTSSAFPTLRPPSSWAPKKRRSPAAFSAREHRSRAGWNRTSRAS